MGAFVSLPTDPNDPQAQLRRLAAVPTAAALPNLLPFLKPGLAAMSGASLSALPAAQGIGAGFNVLPAQTSNGPLAGPRLQALPSQAPPDLSKVPNLGGNGPLPDLGTAAAPNVSLPASAPASRLGADQIELQRLQSTGDGVSQIKNSWGRGFARVGDIALSLVAPNVTAMTPGFHLHNAALQRQAEQRIGQDQTQLQSAATLADSQAQAVQRQALATQEQAKADSLTNPRPSNGQLLYDKNGSPIGFQDGGGNYFGPQDPSLPQGVRDVLASAQRKTPTSAFELWQQQNPKGAAEDYLKMEADGKNKPLDQQLIEAEAAGDGAKANTIRHVIQETKVQPQIQIHTATERPEASGTWTPGNGQDGKPVMFNSKTGEVRPMADGFTKGPTAGQSKKIGSDEQKRADLAKNMNENLDSLDDIAGRRPELFGALAGRLTDAKVAFGTSDPDIAKLEVIKHNLGMVQQGVHGMRSAQGVESAAAALLNGYHNSPDALRAATKAARDSASTFLNNSQNPGQPRTAPSGVRMQAPDGSIQMVDPAHVSHYTQLGAKVVK